jgi:colicin import membrane protein
MKAYENAIGEENMRVLSSFSDLPMYNFGVSVQKEMEDTERQFLEQNIQASLAQKELDLEDAIAIRQLKDINQAERLLIVRRKKRIQKQQEIAQQNSQMQAQQQAQATQAASQARQQELQVESQIKAQEMQLKNQLEIQLEQVKHQYRKEIEMIRAQATLGFRTEEQEFKEKLEVLKEDRKDERVKRESAEQSKLISQRQGKRSELSEPAAEGGADIIDEILGQ